MCKQFPDNRSRSKDNFVKPAEFMKDPINGYMFHRQFECLAQMKILLDLPEFCLVRSKGYVVNSVVTDTSERIGLIQKILTFKPVHLHVGHVFEISHIWWTHTTKKY